MGRVDWFPEAFMAKAEKAAMDGVESWAKINWLTQAREDCPVGQYPPSSGRTGGTMRASLDVERDDENNMIHMGGGGAAADYILINELDRSRNHAVGKAGFIRDSFDMHIAELAPTVQQFIDRM
jgi:hypothetical protein